MIRNFFRIYKKHIKSNFSNLVINFVALFLSFFAIITIVNFISIETELKQKILESYPNYEIYKISKFENITFDNGYNIVQKKRPSLNEIKNINYFSDSIIDYDLSYLLENYTVKKDNLIKNIIISFEPHFENTNTFYFNNSDLKDVSIEFNKDFLFLIDEKNIYETFKWNISEYKFEEVKTFNFLSISTIYYPYNLLKNAANLTYFSSIEDNLYNYIASKSSTDIETNYSLVGKFSSLNLESFNNSEYKNLYEITNTALEVTENFMKLFVTILDFCLYFLMLIIVLVFILIIYTVYLIILKNHKEIALLRTYGYSKTFINFEYLTEILLLFVLSFVFASLLSILSIYLVNTYLFASLNIYLNFSLNLKILLQIFVLGFFSITIVTQIPLLKVNKIDIRKELNSI